MSCRFFHSLSGPRLGKYWTLTPSGRSFPSCLIVSYSSLFHLVKPHFFEMTIFCLPGNLNLALLNASIQDASCWGLERMDMMGCPMCTRATVPWGFPNAPLIPVWSLSAPAHDNILFILRTWNGWSLILMWNWSLPHLFTIYLLAQMRAASRASLLNCSYSSDTMWMHKGKASTGVFLAPKSKIRIFESILSR